MTAGATAGLHGPEDSRNPLSLVTEKPLQGREINVRIQMTLDLPHGRPRRAVL